MRYAFIEDHRATWPIAIQCRVLAVSRSGYYEWRRRPVSERAQRRESLTAQIREFHVGHHASYGSPRVHRELRARGDKVNEKTVAKVMREAGIQAKSQRQFRVTTTDSNHTQPVAENTLNREFTAQQRNQKWVADITYIATLEGWLYLAAVIDLFTRKVVGWSMRWRWRCLASFPRHQGFLVRASSRIPIVACNTPASTIKACSRNTTSNAA